MSEEPKPRCRSCGAELTGKDIYEGMCKACREEAILGTPPEKHVETRPKPRPRDGKPVVQAPQATIALETEVDAEADTRELAPTPEPETPPPQATAPEVEEPSEPQASEKPTSDLGLALIPEVPDAQGALPPETTTEAAPPLAEEPAPSDDAPTLAFLEPSEGPPDEPRLVPEVPDTPPTEQEAVATATDAPARPRQPQPAPAPEAPAGPDRVVLDLEGQLAQLRPLLVEMTAELRSLRESLARQEGPPVSPVRFGFKAFFGFLLAGGLAALVGLGLAALVGVLFYPPALDALRRLFQALAGG